MMDAFHRRQRFGREKNFSASFDGTVTDGCNPVNFLFLNESILNSVPVELLDS